MTIKKQINKLAKNIRKAVNIDFVDSFRIAKWYVRSYNFTKMPDRVSYVMKVYDPDDPSDMYAVIYIDNIPMSSLLP